MPSAAPPKSIDTVIVGNGPSALILSYILHGNIPYYSRTNPHPDPILRSKLKPNLLDVDFADLTAHFPGSRFSYSTSTLPINVLLDTLLRPLADTEPGAHASCVEWRREPARAVPHVLLGNTPPGGQWASNPVNAGWDIGTLSYLDQLSLPGYSFREHLRTKGREKEPEFLRPTRRNVADYLAAYPDAAGVSDAVRPPSTVAGVSSTSTGFYVASHDLHCAHLVLASGIFASLLPTTSILAHQITLSPSSPTSSSSHPLLVIGSGFSAADIILTNLPQRSIMHIFPWDPSRRPSPLRSAHRHAYPEYASVYRRMKRAAGAVLGEGAVTSPLGRGKGMNPFFDGAGEGMYEGCPNAEVIEARTEKDGTGKVVVRLGDGQVVERAVGGLAYVIGRRGSLGYLEDPLQQEVLGDELECVDRVSKKTLRDKVDAGLEVAPNVFVVGSLAGDTLIRYTYGSCVFAAREITGRRRDQELGSKAENGST